MNPQGYEQQPVYPGPPGGYPAPAPPPPPTSKCTCKVATIKRLGRRLQWS